MCIIPLLLHSFIHLAPTFYNVCLPVLQFPHVCIIPSLLHSFIHLAPVFYNIFLSQYFSFPLSVSFHHSSTHSSIYHTHCIIFVFQYFIFSLSNSFHHCSNQSSIYHPHCIMSFSQYFCFALSVHSIIAILIHPSTTHTV